MAEKMLGKHADRLGQARGRFSSQAHEPFLRKCLYKESGPEILATTPKEIVKITKKCGIASFHSGERVGCVSKKVIGWFPHKKIFNFQPSHWILTRLSPMAFENDNWPLLLHGTPPQQARGFHKSNFHARNCDPGGWPRVYILESCLNFIVNSILSRSNRDGEFRVIVFLWCSLIYFLSTTVLGVG